MTNSVQTEYQDNLEKLYNLVKRLKKGDILWERTNKKRTISAIRSIWNDFRFTKSPLLEYYPIELIVANCINDLGQECISRGLDWSIEGHIRKNLSRWSNDKLKAIKALNGH